MGEKEVLFVLLDRFADWEAASLAAALNELSPGRVKTIAPAREPVSSIGGFRVLPDYGFAAYNGEFDALILIGGNSWRKEIAKEVLPLVQKAVEDQAVLGAICDATVFLGMNGFLNEAAHTSNMLSDLKAAAGGRYTGQDRYQLRPAVRDDTLITANGTAFLEFGREVLLALKAAPVEEIEEWYREFKLGYYGAREAGQQRQDLP
ncbi:MAG TPA: type 1 glutamine amidotransferase family protein [Feifaniaceae bacterium]|nr:type 1 glutamine amidotransferase family protein [Feifaniaceae bacterium]